jgi:hypothetical protein
MPANKLHPDSDCNQNPKNRNTQCDKKHEEKIQQPEEEKQ